MSNQNRTVLKQLEKTDFLVVSGKTQKPTVNDRLAELGPAIIGGAGETPAPDWNQVQEWGIAALESSAAEVREKDRGHRKTRVRLADARRARNGKMTLITAAHRALRQRQGFLLGEDFQARESLEALDRALEEGGRRLSADARARIYYCRSYANHFLARS